MIVSPSGDIAFLSIGDNQCFFDTTWRAPNEPQAERQKKRAMGRKKSEDTHIF
jgi:hypothetical protein